MKPDSSNLHSVADLAALSAAAQGTPKASNQIEDPSREARIAELKAKFDAGILPVDEQAIAAKLIDSHTADCRSSQK